MIDLRYATLKAYLCMHLEWTQVELLTCWEAAETAKQLSDLVWFEIKWISATSSKHWSVTRSINIQFFGRSPNRRAYNFRILCPTVFSGLWPKQAARPNALVRMKVQQKMRRERERDTRIENQFLPNPIPRRLSLFTHFFFFYSTCPWSRVIQPNGLVLLTDWSEPVTRNGRFSGPD